MIQNAVVKRIVSPGIVEVSLMRQLECGLNCKSCEGCPQKPKEEILALAGDSFGSVPGNFVEVESNAGSSIGIAALVYLVPCIGLLLGYFLGILFGWAEMACVFLAFVGVVLGFVPALLINRIILNRKKPEFTIIAIRR